MSRIQISWTQDSYVWQKSTIQMGLRHIVATAHEMTKKANRSRTTKAATIDWTFSTISAIFKMPLMLMTYVVVHSRLGPRSRGGVGVSNMATITHTYLHCKFMTLNPLQCKGNYSATSNNSLWNWYIGRWWMSCYIRYSEKGTGRGRSPSRPVLAVPKCNSPPINGQCTNHRIAV